MCYDRLLLAIGSAYLRACVFPTPCVCGAAHPDQIRMTVIISPCMNPKKKNPTRRLRRSSGGGGGGGGESKTQVMKMIICTLLYEYIMSGRGI